MEYTAPASRFPCEEEQRWRRGRSWPRARGLRPNFFPGFCFYKFLYVWLDLHLEDGRRSRFLGWMYWIPNPLLPFIWFRAALPQAHPDLEVLELESPAG